MTATITITDSCPVGVSVEMVMDPPIDVTSDQSPVSRAVMIIIDALANASKVE